MEIAAVVEAAASAFKIVYQSHSESDEDNAVETDVLLSQLVRARKRKQRSTCRVPVRIKLFVEVTVSMFNEKEFQEDFRLPRRTYERLLELIRPFLETTAQTGRRKMNAEKQLLAVIWLLATPDSYR